jgi:hypothetical protein
MATGRCVWSLAFVIAIGVQPRLSPLLAAESAASDAPSLDGAWALSEKWTGYMGIALVIKGDTFKYWFYSDAKTGNEPKYPITGKAEIKKGVIHLTPTDPKLRLYSSAWQSVVYKGQTCLIAESDLKKFREKHEDDRLLYKLDAFDEAAPQCNRPEPQRK